MGGSSITTNVIINKHHICSIKKINENMRGLTLSTLSHSSVVAANVVIVETLSTLSHSSVVAANVVIVEREAVIRL